MKCIILGFILSFFVFNTGGYAGSHPAFKKEDIGVLKPCFSMVSVPCDAAVNESMVIDGYIFGENGVGLLNATIKFYNKTTMALQTQVNSDATGYYYAQFVYTGQAERTTLEDKLYPNPSMGQTNIIFNANQTGKYILTVTDIQGKPYTKELNAQTGANKITLTGGSTGLHLINIQNNAGDEHTLELIQTTNTGSKFTSSEAVQVDKSQLKSTMDNPNSLDSLLIEVSAPNYITKTLTVAPGTQTQNITLSVQPTTFDFTAYALTIMGDTIKPGKEINAVSINVKRSSDNVVMNFPAVNGMIHMYWQETTTTPSTTIEISNADTTTFCTNWIFGLKQDPLINVKELNLFQSSKELSPTWNNYIPPGPATATLSTLPQQFDMYLMPRLIVAANGTTYHTEGLTFRTMATCRSPPASTRKYEEIPQVANTIFIYEMQIPDSINSGLPQITTQQKLAQKEALDSTVTLFKLHNKRQIFPNFQREEINSSTNSTWLEGFNRGWDQTHQVYYKSNGNAENGVAFTNSYGIGGISRIKTGEAAYLFNDSQILKVTEMIQSFTNSQDPLGGSSAYFYSTTTGISEFAEVLFDYIHIANPNSCPK